MNSGISVTMPGSISVARADREHGLAQREAQPRERVAGHGRGHDRPPIVSSAIAVLFQNHSTTGASWKTVA